MFRLRKKDPFPATVAAKPAPLGDDAAAMSPPRDFLPRDLRRFYDLYDPHFRKAMLAELQTRVGEWFEVWKAERVARNEDAWQQRTQLIATHTANMDKRMAATEANSGKAVEASARAAEAQRALEAELAALKKSASEAPDVGGRLAALEGRLTALEANGARAPEPPAGRPAAAKPKKSEVEVLRERVKELEETQARVDGEGVDGEVEPPVEEPGDLKDAEGDGDSDLTGAPAEIPVLKHAKPKDPVLAKVDERLTRLEPAAKVKVRPDKLLWLATGHGTAQRVGLALVAKTHGINASYTDLDAAARALDLQIIDIGGKKYYNRTGASKPPAE